MGYIQNNKVLTEGYHIGSQTPIDDRLVYESISDAISLGIDDEQAYRFYEGLRIWCLADNKEYVWTESSTGVIPGGFTYPSGVSSHGVFYGNRTFNFVPTGYVSSGAPTIYTTTINLIQNVVYPIVISGVGTEIVSVSLYDINSKDISNSFQVDIDDLTLTVSLESNVNVSDITVKILYIPI